MPIDYDYYGYPSILYARWVGCIPVADMLGYEALVLEDKTAHQTARELCDPTHVESLDYAPADLMQSILRRGSRHHGTHLATLKAILVPDARFLGFARDCRRLVESLTQDDVQIVSEEAAALALLGRQETTLKEFLAAAGPLLHNGG